MNVDAKKLRIARELQRLAAEHIGVPRLAHRSTHLGNVAKLRNEYITLEEEYCRAVGDSIDAWHWGETMAPLPPVASAWRLARINAAVTLWEMLYSEHTTNGRSDLVFPPPLDSEEDVVRWLLSDWWLEHGITLCTMVR